jgi:hypothetical protein
MGIPRTHMPVQVRIDDDYTLLQRLQIQKAFDSWEQACNYKIQFELTWNQRKPGRYLDYAEPENTGLFFWSLSKNEYDLGGKRLEEWSSYYGVMVYGVDADSGNLIIFEDVDDEKFYGVVMHEIGHLIGLKHIEPQYAVMHPSAVVLDGALQPLDRQQLQDLYHCY